MACHGPLTPPPPKTVTSYVDGPLETFQKFNKTVTLFVEDPLKYSVNLFNVNTPGEYICLLFSNQNKRVFLDILLEN
jgi:hypothetical protein